MARSRLGRAGSDNALALVYQEPLLLVNDVLGRVDTLARSYPTIPRWQRLQWFAAALSAWLTTLALLIGRIDWAVLTTYGFGIIGSLSYAWNRKAWRYLFPALLSANVVAAFVANSTWLIITSLLLREFLSPLFKPSLRDVIAHKPSKAKLVEKARQLCADGKG